MEKTEQTERIRTMEARMLKAKAVLEELEKALDAYEEAEDDFYALIDYILSGMFLKDFRDDEEGKLPPYEELPRGVLSEDALDDVLDSRTDLLARMMQIADDEREEEK